MPSIPQWLLRHEVTVEPFEGYSGTGPVYGPGVQVLCFVEDARKLVLDSDGREVVSSGRLFTTLDSPVNTHARVTYRGRTSHVVAVTRRDGGGLPTPDHVEAAIT